MRRRIPSLLVVGLMVVLLASCGQPPAGQQAAVPTATPTQHATSPGLSGQIAWQGFLDQNQTTAAIFSAKADGTDVRQLTHPNPGEEDANPDWSPDGSKILFTFVPTNGPSEIFVMNAEGTGLKQITGGENGTGVGKWSPDGSQIVYCVAENPIRPDGNATVERLWIMHADGSHPMQFTNPPLPASIADNSPSWSPDGKRILFQSFGSFPNGATPQIYTIFPNGTHQVQLTTKERNTWPAWSPDGTKIIFAHRFTAGQDQNAHLYEMNLDGSGLVQVTKNEFWQLQPAWGPPP